MMIANVGVSMPVFWLGLMLAYLFALVLKGTPFALPPSGRNTAGLVFTPADRGLARAGSAGLLYGRDRLPFQHEPLQYPGHRQLVRLLGLCPST